VRFSSVFFFGLNLVTMLLFMFGALAVLRPAGIVPKPDMLIYDQAVILGQVWGGPGRTLFLVIGMATLFSTQLVIVDGIARALSDIIYTSFARARKRDVSWWYLLIAMSWMLVGCGFTAFMEWSGVTNLGFLLSAAYMGGFAMAVYVPLLLWINLRQLPPSARPGKANLLFVGLATAVYVGFSVVCIHTELS